MFTLLQCISSGWRREKKKFFRNVSVTKRHVAFAARYRDSSFVAQLSWLCNLQTRTMECCSLVFIPRSWAWSNFYRFNGIIEFQLNSFLSLPLFIANLDNSRRRKDICEKKWNKFDIFPCRLLINDKEEKQWNWKIIPSNVRIVF